MKALYMVRPKGVNLKEVMYVTEDYDKAIKVATQLALEDVDDWHCWEVIKVDKEVLPSKECIDDEFGLAIFEREPLFIYKYRRKV